MAEKKRGLGRGLQDLLTGSSDWLKREDIQLFYCPVEQLVPNPYQPRQKIDPAELNELAESIAAKGVIQPLLVARTDDPQQYQILAGERRWRAAQTAGLEQVPVLLRETSASEALEIALIENIQRRDLNCIEEALAYQQLQREFGLTQDEISQRVGKDRSTVANTLRLLRLPGKLQEDVVNGRLSMGHARALLAVSDPEEQLRIRNLILQQHLSVRQTEKLIESGRAKGKPQPAPPDPRVQVVQESLHSRFQTPVSVRRRGRKGAITIRFSSDDELRRLLELMGIEPPAQPQEE
jgi:ParB family chromosome partitioning protein